MNTNTKKFKETSIPEIYSKSLAKQSFLIRSSNVYRIATVLFHRTSMCLASIKNTTVPKAVVFKTVDQQFLAAAKVSFVSNDESAPASGRWDYTWTTREEDIKDCDCVVLGTNSLLTTFYASSGMSLYNMKFQSPDLSVLMMDLMVETIIEWLKENVDTKLVLDGVFEALASVEDGKTYVSIIPAGEMKVLIKDDEAVE